MPDMPGDKFKYENSLEDEMVRSYPRQLQLGLEPGERTRGWGEDEPIITEQVFLQSQGYHLKPTPLHNPDTESGLLEDPDLAARWKEESDSSETGEQEWVWTNKKNPKLTVAMHTFYTENDEDGSRSVEWYVYPAYEERGIPNSPYLTSDEDDALRAARNLLHQSNSELKG